MEELSLSNANYEVAKELLKARFGDPDVMRQLIYNQLGKLPRCSGNTAQLRDFVTEPMLHHRVVFYSGIVIKKKNQGQYCLQIQDCSKGHLMQGTCKKKCECPKWA